MGATLDYGCMVYEAAAKNNLEKLDRIQCSQIKIQGDEVQMCLDSATAVQSIKWGRTLGQTVREDLLFELYMILLNQQQPGMDVHLCRIPSQVERN